MGKNFYIFIVTIILTFALVNSIKLHLQTTSTVTYDSLKSKLDSSIDYKYYDNLNSFNTNFYYGTITK